MTGKRRFIELTYYETYYFANIVKNVLEDQFSYLRQLDEFYGDERYLSYSSAFPRFSAFHSFIRSIVSDVFSDDMNNMQLDIRQDNAERFKSIPSALDPHPSKLPVNLALDSFKIAHDPFDAWLSSRGISFLDARDDDVAEYYEDLHREGQMDQLLERATAEVFFVLFQNRSVLLNFNEMMARQFEHGALDGGTDSAFGDDFARPGVLRRVSIPAWVRRAVYFRDRGMCVICAADLSGVLAIGSEENYDHIVPLASGGLNDVTNIQLLCKSCNSKKRARSAVTSNRYEAWYRSE